MILEPVVLQLQRRPGPLLPQIQAALAAHGEPLRWAITAVMPASAPGELVDGQPAPAHPDPLGSELRLEAIVCRPDGDVPPEPGFSERGLPEPADGWQAAPERP